MIGFQRIISQEKRVFSSITTTLAYIAWARSDKMCLSYLAHSNLNRFGRLCFAKNSIKKRKTSKTLLRFSSACQSIPTTKFQPIVFSSVSNLSLKKRVWESGTSTMSEFPYTTWDTLYMLTQWAIIREYWSLSLRSDRVWNTNDSEPKRPTTNFSKSRVSL